MFTHRKLCKVCNCVAMDKEVTEDVFQTLLDEFDLEFSQEKGIEYAISYTTCAKCQSYEDNEDDYA